ncbi:MAG: ELM1/GtrOC1 family putative glycosyltransferase [Wenzhouxiangellaceae bacterium]
MPLITQRIVRGLTPFIDPILTPATRQRPEKIILGVRPGHRPSDKPPVRIFLGSERRQFRAERVFIWSVEKHRDPSRIYEIHLLKGLKGYVSGFWITGFTNYRFAIPHFCDYQGRGIYNDVDQVWLTDPAELFDRDMGKAGFLSINDHDTSVMLIDCRRMSGVWNRDAVVKTTRKRIEARARAAGLWGEMEGRFNARDKEYEPGESACVHFTTLHTQPWRPFPEWFVYQDNPTGSLWFELEREADQAHFLPVSALRPSLAWPDTSLALSARDDGPEITRLLGVHPAADLHADTRRVRGLLERVPDADLPWVLDRLFAMSANLEIELREPIWIRRGKPRRSLHFWIEQLHLAQRLNPETRWRLERRVGTRRRVLTGGPLPEGPVATVSGPGARTRSKAEAVGGALARVSGREMIRVGRHGGRVVNGVRALTGRGLIDDADPAPAILVASGALAARAARRAVARSERPPALVLVGRNAGRVPEHAGVAVSMAHHDLPPHPNRITTLLGFGHRDEWQPAVDTRRWQDWLESRPRCALIVGRNPHGDWSSSELEVLLNDARQWARERNARLLIVTTRHSAAAGPWLQRRADENVDVYAWRRDDDDDPYSIALEHAGALLIAGGTPGVLQDAVAGPKPVYLVPWLEHPGAWKRFASSVAARAFRPSYNKRGSIRPQQGLTYVCARLVERGWVLPPRGLADWQRLLVERGLAAWIGSRAIPSRRHVAELTSVCHRIMRRLEPNADAPGAGKDKVRP